MIKDCPLLELSQIAWMPYNFLAFKRNIFVIFLVVVKQGSVSMHI